MTPAGCQDTGWHLTASETDMVGVVALIGMISMIGMMGMMVMLGVIKKRVWWV